VSDRVAIEKSVGSQLDVLMSLILDEMAVQHGKLFREIYYFKN